MLTCEQIYCYQDKWIAGLSKKNIIFKNVEHRVDDQRLVSNGIELTPAKIAHCNNQCAIPYTLFINKLCTTLTDLPALAKSVRGDNGLL